MTDAEIEEGLRICEAATPGPWTVVEPEIGVYYLRGDHGMVFKILASSVQRSPDDIALIAYARTALPEALKEIKRLREALAPFTKIDTGNDEWPLMPEPKATFIVGEPTIADCRRAKRLLSP